MNPDPRGRRYTTATINEVKRHADAGWSQREIRRVMLREYGQAPSVETISRWLSDSYAEKSRARVVRNERAARATANGGRLAGRARTPDFRLARIESLSRLRLSCEAIAKVMTFDFPDAPLTGRQVQYALETKSTRALRPQVAVA